MGKSKTKVIQTDFGTFRQNQVYPGVIQPYSKLCVNLAYLKPLYVQNPDIFKIRNIWDHSNVTQCYFWRNFDPLFPPCNGP